MWGMLLPVAAAMAEQTTTDETTKVFSLGVVEVSSSAPIAETSPLAETVAAEEIQRFNRYDVGSAINLLPGVTLQNLGARNERLAYVRGFNSRQVPLFIDGIPVYVPYDGNVDLNRFTTFDIGEIVVNKGFASVLYGPNTLGGAINLVSRRPTRRLEGNLGTGVGFDSRFDYNFYQGHFNVGTNQEPGTPRAVFPTWIVHSSACRTISCRFRAKTAGAGTTAGTPITRAASRSATRPTPPTNTPSATTTKTAARIRRPMPAGIGP